MRKYVGRPVLRHEDERLLRGEGQFVADIVLPDMLHVVFVRSDQAHARIRSIDVARAAAAPGVAAVLTGDDLARQLPPVRDNQAALPKKWRAAVEHTILNPRQPLIAIDRVRHVGEAMVAVVAESVHAAEDAAELVAIDLEPLPAVLDPESAFAPDAPVLHDHLGTNCIGEFKLEKGDAARALAAAPHRLRRRFVHHRYAAMPIECRGVVCAYEPRTGSLTVHSATQVVHWLRREIAATLAIPEARVRAIAPDVGGGFGVKGHIYPEELVLPFLARRFRRPMRWIETRREHFLSAAHSRDQQHDVEVGFDGDGRILAFRDEYAMDCGAYNPLGVSPVFNTAAHLQGPYRIPNFAVHARVAATNKVPNAPYRGAGRPEAVQVTERMMDLVARELGLEPAEVRRRNMIGAAEMPYPLGIVYRDGVPIEYDSGDFPRMLDAALEALGGVAAFRARQAEMRAQGRRIGLGIGCYTEGTGAGPFEGATVRIDPSGKITVASGVAPQGQGMETVFAQVAADWWQVAPEDVIVTLGDTAAIAMGFGTIASRSTVNLTGAFHFASERLREKCFDVAAALLECAPTDLELRDGGVGIKGVPGKHLTLADIARNARGWDRVRRGELELGLEETYYYEPPTVTWAYATHAAIVEVDADTGTVAVERYAVAHDCGTIINPMLVDGQITGGVIQGIGGALLEDIRFDAYGQLLTASFLDYAMPRAADMPAPALVHSESPSPLNPLGVKGLGEGGAIAPPVALANAVCDALGIELNRLPIRPADLARRSLAVLCTVSTSEALRALVPRFERSSGIRVDITYAPAPGLVAKIRAGQTADLFIGPEEYSGPLIDEGRLVRDARKPFARSTAGLAVRAGAVRPAIGTPEQLRAALLAAPSVAYSEGASGQLFERILDRLGIKAAVLAKRAPTLPGEMIGSVVARGGAELGVQQISALLPAPGIEIVGPLPEALQEPIIYGTNEFAGTPARRAIDAFTAFLRSDEARAELRLKGLEPA